MFSDVYLRALSTTPVLNYPDPDKLFWCKQVPVGAVLSQVVDGQERVIEYRSRTLQPDEQELTTREKECLFVYVCLFIFMFV